MKSNLSKLVTWLWCIHLVYWCSYPFSAKIHWCVCVCVRACVCNLIIFKSLVTNIVTIFLNQARAHSRPLAGCGCAPGLLKLFS